MQSPPTLTDIATLAAHRRRTRDTALFLHDEAILEVKEKLIDVNRTFTRPCIITGQPKPWAAAFPQAKIVPDDEILDLQEQAHDLAIHAMSLHWANDPVGQLVQMRRSLQPDGLAIAVLPGGRTLHELRTALAEAESRITGGLSPRIAPMAEIRDLGALLQRAGFALPVADSLPLATRYADAFRLMHELRHMGEANALAERDRRPPPRALFPLAAALYAENFPSEGGIAATFELVFLSGWAPSSTQQQPLRPGSARQRLADALGTDEQQAGDTATPRRD
ncbi:SAM-dependent methyltransferase [Mesobaculum littorinae]|uniref:SAM-dependent methyltransferase n=1 Tax=Mesobaculum littorinae TaxID=2486419 RepID=A0A438AHC1_9RHOB|nr:SAM-dependent methyltransferase [Mesobaculum littorinae]RVV98100.1 SAM-dependent methyltransferase [Mesobaculum littorinae]